MTTPAKAIEDGARAIMRHPDMMTWGIALALSEACIAAAIASGELVPASAGQLAAKLWLYEDNLPEGYPYGEMFAHSEVRDGVRMFPVYTTPASAVAAEREWCAKAAEGPRYLDKYRGEPGHNWWHEKEPGGHNRYGNGRHDAAAAIRSLSPAPASGEFVVVPREPTQAMIKAGGEAWGALGIPYGGPEGIWETMLEAAIKGD